MKECYGDISVATNKRSIITIFILLFLFLCTGTSEARQANFYNDCIFNYQNGEDVDGGNVIINRSGSKCAEICKLRCSVFSSQATYTKDPKEKSSKFIDDPNQSTIDSCMLACQRGQSFKAKMMHEIKDGGAHIFSYATEVAVTGCEYKSVAEKKAGYTHISDRSITQTDIMIPGYNIAKNTLQISLGQGEQKIYACGKKTINLMPLLPNLYHIAPSVAYGGDSEFCFNGRCESDFFDKNIKSPKVAAMMDRVKNKEGPLIDWTISYSTKALTHKMHPCLAALELQDLQTMSAQDVSSCRGDKNCTLERLLDKGNFIWGHNVGADDIVDPDKIPISLTDCFTTWHLFNDLYTETGLVLRDGDEIALNWGGDIIFDGSKLFFPNTSKVLKDKKLYVDHKVAKLAILKDSFESLDIGLINDHVEEALKKDAVNPTALLQVVSDLEIRGLGLLRGEDRIKSGEPQDNIKLCKGKSLSTKIAKPSFLSPQNYRGMVLDFPPLFEVSEKTPPKEEMECHQIKDPMLSRYTIVGTVHGLDGLVPLAIKHKTHVMEGIDDITGGQQVKIDWKGRPIRNGEGIQIAIVDSSDGYIPDSCWIDIGEKLKKESIIKLGNAQKESIDDFKCGKHKDNANYRVYFRLDPNIVKSEEYKSLPHPYNKICDEYSQIGEYKLVVHNSAPSPGFMHKVAVLVSDTLFGEGACSAKIPGDGVVSRVYKAATKQVIPYVTVLLILFLIFTAIYFILGLVEINQKEFINRILKISLVITVVSTSSWDILGGRMVQMFVCGSLNMANYMTPKIEPASGGGYRIVPYGEVLEVFDDFGLWSAFIINGTTWSKIYALITSGIFGVVIALLIVVAGFFIMQTMIKLLLIYLYSLIALSMLIILSPIIFPMLLFPKTREFIFDPWVKYMIAFSILPGMVFSAFSLFCIVMIILVQAVMNFTICKSCFIALPVTGDCIVPGWSLLMSIHSPAADSGGSMFFVPLGVGGAVVALLAVAMVTDQFLIFLIQLVYRIVRVAAFGRRTANIGHIVQQTAAFPQTAAKKVAWEGILQPTWERITGKGGQEDDGDKHKR